MLKALRTLGVETHLVISPAGAMTIHAETPYTLTEVEAMATHTYPARDIGARIASGSFATAGMVVAPCSVKTLAEIACGTTGSLLTRAADVTLKECRRLVLMVRETPLHAGHLENMLKCARLGAVIAPPVPAFYTQPDRLEDIIAHSIGRVLDLFGLESGTVKRWEGL